MSQNNQQKPELTWIGKGDEPKSEASNQFKNRFNV